MKTQVKLSQNIQLKTGQLKVVYRAVKRGEAKGNLRIYPDFTGLTLDTLKTLVGEKLLMHELRQRFDVVFQQYFKRYKGDTTLVLNACTKWLEDEPTNTSKKQLHNAILAAVASRDFEKVKELQEALESL